MVWGVLMKLFSIVHAETRLTLRQYSKEHKVRFFNGDSRPGKSPISSWDFSDKDIHYVISEKRCPGFYYLGYEGLCLWWLDPKEWNIVWGEVGHEEPPLN